MMMGLMWICLLYMRSALAQNTRRSHKQEQLHFLTNKQRHGPPLATFLVRGGGNDGRRPAQRRTRQSLSVLVFPGARLLSTTAEAGSGHCCGRRRPAGRRGLLSVCPAGRVGRRPRRQRRLSPSRSSPRIPPKAFTHGRRRGTPTAHRPPIPSPIVASAQGTTVHTIRLFAGRPAISDSATPFTTTRGPQVLPSPLRRRRRRPPPSSVTNKNVRLDPVTVFGRHLGSSTQVVRSLVYCKRCL